MKATHSTKEIIRIELEGAHTFTAPPEQVWRALHDTALLAAAMPDCEYLTAIRPDQYLGRLRLHAGPIQTRLSGTISLAPADAPHGYQITARGDGDKGTAQGNGRIWLSGAGDKTTLHYQGQITARGEIAGVGPDFLRTTARAIIRQNITALARHLAGTAPARTAVSAENHSPDNRSSLILFVLTLGGMLLLLRAFYRKWLCHDGRSPAHE